MNIYELFIRFSMINGRKLSKIKQLIPNACDQTETNVKEMLHELGFSQQQQDAFWQADRQKIKSALHWLDKSDHHLITYLDKRYPPLLKQINSAPLLLFVKGNQTLLTYPQIAMVGSRHCSHYGAQWSRYFAGQLATQGLTITSGLALGIDALCHLGALDVKGKTIAVLGSGLNHIIPRTHFGLAQDILYHHGAIISEFLPDEVAKPMHFPRRNRIISGLSLATFVVEASIKSGSLITAKYALEQNRDVFALPGDISDENYHGAHQLIQQGAYLVTTPEDILVHLHHSSLYRLINKQSGLSQTNNTDILSVKENKKNYPHPEIFAMIQQKPMPIDVIAQSLSLSVTDVTIKLLDLELAGAIKSVRGGYIRCTTAL
ncbi:DNA-processing protein DprA [Utexia brackfieldae]|uniref:DNA-processing protein DprA n=1 Tax=Utexia brackfieldae TaxID=3074108 RepID=UPI00370D051E